MSNAFHAVVEVIDFIHEYFEEVIDFIHYCL